MVVISRPRYVHRTKYALDGEALDDHRTRSMRRQVLKTIRYTDRAMAQHFVLDISGFLEFEVRQALEKL